MKRFALAVVALVTLVCSTASLEAATWAEVALGIRCTEVSGGGRYSGLYITSVYLESNGAEAGFEGGDIIAYVNGQRVRTYEQLQNAIMADTDGRAVIHVDNARRPGTLARTVVLIPQ